MFCELSANAWNYLGMSVSYYGQWYACDLSIYNLFMVGLNEGGFGVLEVQICNELQSNLSPSIITH